MQDKPETITLMAETAAKALAEGCKPESIRTSFESVRGEPFTDPQWNAILAGAVIIKHLDAAKDER